ncbi:MAG: hypothetical protein O7D86_02085 [Proteobacteria bacterium]|nr:hypothetical protein [Pseudomonadota bacterium]
MDKFNHTSAADESRGTRLLTRGRYSEGSIEKVFSLSIPDIWDQVIKISITEESVADE